MSDEYVKFNINPCGKNVGDCTIRAISTALEQTWEKTYIDICIQGFAMCDMPSANHVWGAYLRSKGFVQNAFPPDTPEEYTVIDFCHEHPNGTYILACSGHVVAIINGHYYDDWDCGNRTPIYYWERRN